MTVPIHHEGSALTAEEKNTTRVSAIDGENHACNDGTDRKNDCDRRTKLIRVRRRPCSANTSGDPFVPIDTLRTPDANANELSTAGCEEWFSERRSNTTVAMMVLAPRKIRRAWSEMTFTIQ